MIEIGRFELQKGDVVLLTCEHSVLSKDQLTALENLMKEKLAAAGFDNPVIAISGLTLGVVRKAAA